MDTPARSFPVSMGESIALQDKPSGRTTQAHTVPAHEDSVRLIHATLFETAPEPIIATDAQGRIFGANVEAEKRFGYSRNELLGQLVEILIPERFREAHAQRRQAFHADSTFRRMEFGYQMFARRKDGTEFPVDININSIKTRTETLFYSVVRDASERLAAQRTARYLAFEKAFALLSSKFVNVPPGRIDDEINSGLRIIAESLDMERATLGRLDPVSGQIEITYAWAKPPFSAFPHASLKGNYPWLEDRIRRGELSLTDTPEDLPPEAARERLQMKSMSEKSAVVVPFRVAGNVIGGMHISRITDYVHWDEYLLARMQEVADLFANALARKQADHELQKAMAQIRELKDKVEQENVYLREEIKLEHAHSMVVGNSAGIRAVLKKAEQVASTDSAVLILGETGTGKELIAHTIHEMSRRRNRPMVKVNCAALPSTLIESELFGREKGAYTGALAREIGRFELADKSTIFLDEIGELPPETQSKLLRVLQEGEFERLGSPKTIRVDVRVIAATSRNLNSMVQENKFREDLFYRLNVFPIVLPPLRERREDIPALVWHMLHSLGNRMGRNIEGVHAGTMRDLQNYPWPGNVRELANVIERNLIVSTGHIFRAELPEVQNNNRSFRPLEEVESEYLQKVLQATRWRVRGNGGAAEVLGLKATTLEARLKKLGIRRPY